MSRLKDIINIIINGHIFSFELIYIIYTYFCLLLLECSTRMPNRIKE